MDDFLKGLTRFAQLGTNRIQLVTEKLKAGTISLKFAQDFLVSINSIREGVSSILEVFNAVGALVFIFGNIPEATMDLLDEAVKATNDYNLAAEELQNEINKHPPF